MTRTTRPRSGIALRTVAARINARALFARTSVPFHVASSRTMMKKPPPQLQVRKSQVGFGKNLAHLGLTAQVQLSSLNAVPKFHFKLYDIFTGEEKLLNKQSTWKV